MGSVPREQFLAPAERIMLMRIALSIDCGQTISQPYMVALMSQALELAGDEQVLEIGGGSGYQTAVLAELAHGSVVSIERHAELSAQARRTPAAARLSKCEADRGRWHPRLARALAPYDGILVAAAGREVPAARSREQLREGPLGDAGRGNAAEQESRGAPQSRWHACEAVAHPLPVRAAWLGEQGWPEA